MAQCIFRHMPNFHQWIERLVQDFPTAGKFCSQQRKCPATAHVRIDAFTNQLGPDFIDVGVGHCWQPSDWHNNRAAAEMPHCEQAYIVRLGVQSDCSQEQNTGGVLSQEKPNRSDVEMLITLFKLQSSSAGDCSDPLSAHPPGRLAARGYTRRSAGAFRP
jgi:hypothetical protein